MKNTPEISIITPTYNRAHLLSRAIQSVLAQTYTDWEYIIVDDASTDNSKEIVNNFKDSRIKFLQNQTNGGNAVARNIGVNAAQGNYIAFLDSDDEYWPDYLKKALNKIKEHPKSDFLWSGTRTNHSDGSFTDSVWVPKRKQNPNQFLYELHVGIGRGFLIKSECFQYLKFDENLRTAVDTDFLIRLKKIYKYTILEEVLISIYTQPGSVRSDFSEKKKSYNIIINKNYKIIQNDDFLNYKWYYKLFWLSLYAEDRKLAGKAYARIKKNSFKPRILKLIFKILPTSKAIKIHKIISN